MSDKPKFAYEVKFYKTAEDILLDHFNGMCAIEGEEFARSVEDIKGGGFNQNGEEVEFDGVEVTEANKERGHWGWTDTPGRVVHIWADLKKVSDEDILLLAGHELGHLMIEVAPEIHPRLPLGFGEDENAEFDEAMELESQADEYGMVAVEAYRILRKAKDFYASEWP